ncbi:hypothetical protein EJ07DRAFT_28145, partial [Lizonia empirigonia]
AYLTSSELLRAASKATTSLINGQIDYLLINGAYFASKPDIFLDELPKTNITGPLFTIKSFLPLLCAGREKRVTYISSGVADVSDSVGVRTANSVPYAATMAGGNLVIAKFAAELLDKGFTFLSI